MLGKLFTTRRGTDVIVTVTALIGVVLIFAVDNARTGTIVFLATTTVEAGLFTLIYGLRSDWRASDAARAVFWIVLAYFLVAAHLLTMYLSPRRFWWTDDLRQVLYLGLVLSGLNLLLTMIRLLGRRVYRRSWPV